MCTQSPPSLQFALVRLRRGFTLVEVLVTLGVLSLLLGVVLAVVSGASGIWGKTREKVQQMHQGRAAFEMITRRLSEATLNPYFDYVDANGITRTEANALTFVPVRYQRQSELRFISGPTSTIDLLGNATRPTHALFFQAPLGHAVLSQFGGLPNLLNTCGYFVQYGSDEATIPAVLGTNFARKRFRLMEVIEPSDSMELYARTSGASGYTGREWFNVPASQPANISSVGENVIALVLLPKLSRSDQQGGITDASLAPGYFYDSTVGRSNAALNSFHQLPPEVDVTMVVLDEMTAVRMGDAEHDALLLLLQGLFQEPGSVVDPNLAGYAADLKTLCTYLDDKKFRYQVFTSTVVLKGAKWSRHQSY